MDDVMTVLDAVESTSHAVFGLSQAGPMAILFAATHPERIQALALYGTYPVARKRDDYPWGRSPEWLEQLGRQIDQEWGSGSFLSFLATFDGPARALRCAQAIVDSVRMVGAEVRTGVHTGEVELIGDHVGGIAVHIGARVAAAAGPGEVLASGTVKDLVAGSDIEFEDRGPHSVKGVPGKWRLFAARA